MTGGKLSVKIFLILQEVNLPEKRSLCIKSTLVWLLMVRNKVCFLWILWWPSGVGVLLRTMAVSLGKYTLEMKCIDIFVLVLQSAALILIHSSKALIFNCFLLLLIEQLLCFRKSCKHWMSFNYLIVPTIPWCCYHSLLMDEEPEAQRDPLMCTWPCG